MSDIRSELENAIVEALEASDRLTTVRTFEASIRECLFTGEKFTAGFRPEEMPAIGVSAQLKPMISTPATVGEKEHKIPISVTAVARASKRADALAAVAELQDGIGAVTDQFRRSGNSLGANTVLFGDVACSATTVEEKPFWFAVSTTEFTISRVVEL